MAKKNIKIEEYKNSIIEKILKLQKLKTSLPDIYKNMSLFELSNIDHFLKKIIEQIDGRIPKNEKKY